MKVLVTGATGFVGARLVQRLRNENACQVLGAVRREHSLLAPDIFICGDIGPDTDWASGLVGVDAVVHCAARVHVMDEQATDPLVAFRRVNLEGQHPGQQEQGQQNHGTEGTVRFGQADRRAGVGFSHEQAGDKEG